MKLSIIIASWNVRECLIECLRSIFENPPVCGFEVIVVDNGSSDGTVEAVKRHFSDIKVIANPTNIGFAAANNRGFERAEGQYALLLNPDTIVHEDSLDTLVGFMDDNPDAGACGPKLLNADGTIQPSARRFPTFRGALYGYTALRNLGIFRKSYRRWMMKEFEYDRRADVEQLMGSAMVVRRSAVEQTGAMDERFFMYYEEVDLCYRLKKAGWRIVFVPEAIITHLAGRSARQMSVGRRVMRFKSMLAFFRKHRGGFQTTIFQYFFKLGVILAEACKIAEGSAVYLYALAVGDGRRKDKSLSRIRNSREFLAHQALQLVLKG